MSEPYDSNSPSGPSETPGAPTTPAGWGNAPPPPQVAGNPGEKADLPAIAMISVAALGILLQLVFIFLEFVPTEPTDWSELEGFRGSEMQPVIDILRQVEAGQSPLISALIGLVVIAAMGVVLWGGLEMKNRGSWTAAFVSSILLLCLGLCPASALCCCCFLPIPVAIWSIVVLNKPEVKASFARN